MSAQGVHKITHDFELELCRYTGARFAVAVDNMSNALGLCLLRELPKMESKVISIPARTYPSVPCEIIMAGGKVSFFPATQDGMLSGAYRLEPTRIWDSALRFTADMYVPGSLMCISFTGAYKHLKLSKGGAILCDSEDDYEWFKKARNSGRSECSYHVDNFTMLGKNCYMMPEIATRGLLLIAQFYNVDGSKKQMPDTALPYPDLSKFEIYTK